MAATAPIHTMWRLLMSCCAFAFVITVSDAWAKKGGHGGGKPPKEDPVPGCTSASAWINHCSVITEGIQPYAGTSRPRKWLVRCSGVDQQVEVSLYDIGDQVVVLAGAVAKLLDVPPTE